MNLLMITHFAEFPTYSKNAHFFGTNFAQKSVKKYLLMTQSQQGLHYSTCTWTTTMSCLGLKFTLIVEAIIYGVS